MEEEKKIKKAKEISTSEDFADKLIEEGYITESERGEIEAAINIATQNMSKQEKANTIRILAKKIDAPNSNLISQNRLNYASFEKVVQELSKDVEKARKEREIKNQTEQEENTPKNISEEEKRKQEIEEKIKENKTFISDFFNDFLGLENEDITDEEKIDMAKKMSIVEELDDIAKKYQEMGETAEDALAHAMKDLGLSKRDLEDLDMKLAFTQVVGKKYMKLKREGHTEEEIDKIVFAEDSVSVRFVKSECAATGLRESFDAVRKISLDFYKKNRERRVNDLQSKVKDVRVDEKLDVTKLKKKIEDREKMQESLRRVKKRLDDITSEKDDESTKRLNELYKKMTDEYLITGKTVSSIFEQYKKRGLLGELEFGDVLDGIIGEITPQVTAVYGTSNIIALKEHEKECRIVDLTLQEYEEAQINGNNISNERLRNENPKSIQKFKKDEEKRAKELQYFKNYLMLKRNLNPNKKFWNPDELIGEEINPEEIGNKNVKNNSLEQVLRNRDNVNRDRNAIIRLCKEQRISSNEAAQQYFSENPKALENYTKKEREVLTGNQDKTKKNVKENKTLQQINAVLIDRNYKSMKKIAEKLEELRKKEEVEIKGGNSKKIEKIKLKIQKLENKYQKIEKSNQKLEKAKKEKTAEDILNNKVSELDGKIVFKRYLETKKTALEIYEEYVDKGIKITFDEILGAIESEAKGYMNNHDIINLITLEKSTFLKRGQMEFWNERKLIAERNNNLSDARKCQEKIRNIQNELDGGNFVRDRYKVSLIKRTGMVRSDHQKQDISFEKRDNEIVTEETKGNPDKLGTKKQLEPQKMEVENLKVVPGIIPNVKAIAKKGNVTRTTIQSVFSKLFSLRKEKEDASKGITETKDDKKDVTIDQEMMQ